MLEVETVHIDYTNHRGQRRWRMVQPVAVLAGTSPFHRRADNQREVFLRAVDVERGELRDFRMMSIHQWRADQSRSLPVVGEVS